ncbi:ZapG family protein [Lentisalinibacter orientalis]|uniref:ZapG family protein n=1 Tax=Lentisalinibacter orientalis TaxID=2992241 RepID=UPI003866EE2F
MEEFSLVSLLIGAAIGVALGAGGLFVWFRYGGGASGTSSARRREEAYREEVADHFVKTAELVNQLTDSYKEVFDHLREGAGHLVDEEILRQRLDHRDDEKVTLQRIGYAGSGDGRKTGAKRESGATDQPGEAGESRNGGASGDGGEVVDKRRS